MNGRIPPHNEDAEKNILGSCLIDKKSLLIAIDLLQPEDFYSLANKAIFRAIQRVFFSGNTPDIITVKEELGDKINRIGGVVYLAELTDCIPVNTKQHCHVVKDASRRRKIISDLSEIIGNTFNSAVSVKDLISDLQDTALSVSGVLTKGPRHIREIAGESYEEIKIIAANKDPVQGISTGLVDLDAFSGGLPKSNYIVVAGRPGMGKTSLALKFIESAATNGEGVLMFSLEMQDRRLVNRMISMGAGINGRKLKNGYVAEGDWPKIIKTVKKISSQEIYIDDTAALSVTEMAARAKQVAMKTKIGMIVVDYIQLSSGKQGVSQAEEVETISKGLLAMAKNLDVAMVVLSQLNRSVEARPDKRPILSDLRASGAIEQDADIVFFLYRDEVYNKNPDNPNKGIAEIIIGKGRDIGTGMVKVGFNGERTEFFDLSTY